MTDLAASEIGAIGSRTPVRPAARPAVSGWLVGSGLICALAAAPVLALLTMALSGPTDLWPHLVKNVLPAALGDTAWLLAGVAAVTIATGILCAALVATAEFPGRRLFAWALLLPLAMPTYIVAFTYVEILDPLGPVQSALRAAFGFASRRDYLFPEIRSTGGAALVMGAVLYPYVYLTARATFLVQSACVLDAARTLGSSRLHAFLRVGLPLARPAVAVGATLALLEALNDVGATEYLGVRSLSVAVMTTWLNKGSLAGAAQIACVTLALVFALIAFEAWARRQQLYAAAAQRPRPLRPVRLKGWTAILAALVCAVPLLIGFVVPALFLADAALRQIARSGIESGLGAEALTTLLLAGTASAVTVAAGLLVAYAARLSRTAAGQTLVKLACLGYALPGAVLAVGLLAPLAALDNAIDGIARSVLGLSTGLLLSGSGAALVYAYFVRFLAVPAGGLDAGLAKISPHLDMAARSLGRTAAAAAREIHVPLLRPALAAAALLVFVDAMKELPATLLLRPFGVETLATHVYATASRGAFEEGALAALVIVAVGIVPVILLARAGAAIPGEAPSGRARRSPRPA